MCSRWAAACSSAATRSPSLPAARAFARWRESSVAGLLVRHYPHYPLQPFHHALARVELAGWLQRRGRRRRSAARPSALAAAAADRAADRRHLPQPDADRHRLDRGTRPAPGADQGQRPSVQPPLRAVVSRSCGAARHRFRRRADRAGSDLSPEQATAVGGAQRRRHRLLRLRFAQGPRAGRPLCRPARLSQGSVSPAGCLRPAAGGHRARADPGRRGAARDRPAAACGSAGHRRAGPLRGLPRPDGRAQRAARRRLLRQPGRLRDRPADRARGHGLRHAGGEHRHRARRRVRLAPAIVPGPYGFRRRWRLP